MATLIGTGSHGSDIRSTLPPTWRWVAHHSELDDDVVILGINDPHERARIATLLGIVDESWVHPTAYLGIKTRIGAGTHVNYQTAMTRTTIGDHCTISPGVTICGDVVIGDRVLIGAAATICDRVTIGDDATIGAGAVVLPETVVFDAETWVGVPAAPR